MRRACVDLWDDRCMSAITCTRRTYDHRLRSIINEGGNPDLLADLAIPRSTLASWVARGPIDVVTLDDRDVVALQAEVLRLRRLVGTLLAVVGLIKAMVRVSGFKLNMERLPDGREKAKLLVAIDRSVKTLALSTTLRIVSLSPSRYHAWKRGERVCGLDDRESCPQTFPTQLTPKEILVMKDMVTSDEYRHMPLRGLSLLAQRTGRICASVSTWAKQIKTRGWRRPRQRVYPPKPKVGVRATEPDEIWHLDVTQLRLLDGTKAYIHAVIDNFSRRILAWTIARNLDPSNTCLVLKQAGEKLFGTTPTLYVDNGIENFNHQVDELHEAGIIKRVLAQVEVAFSNSMIEAFWRSMKHQWLFLNSLDSFEKLKSLVEFYITEHNTRMPHAAFKGETPDEIYFGTGAAIPDELAARRKDTRRARLAFNRGSRCGACPGSSSNDSGDVAIASG